MEFWVAAGVVRNIEGRRGRRGIPKIRYGIWTIGSSKDFAAPIRLGCGFSCKHNRTACSDGTLIDGQPDETVGLRKLWFAAIGICLFKECSGD